MTPRTQKKKGAVPAAHPEEKKHLSGQWSSTWVFVLAASGAAIGFNNLWQFPSLVATHGGGAFVIVYLLCIAAIGLPLLVTEIMIGRLGRASPFYALSHVAEQSQASRHWRWLGALAMLGGFLIFSYLSVVAGWTMAYTLRMALGVFTGLTADGIGALFTQLVHDPEKQLFWHTLFIVVWGSSRSCATRRRQCFFYFWRCSSMHSFCRAWIRPSSSCCVSILHT